MNTQIDYSDEPTADLRGLLEEMTPLCGYSQRKQLKELFLLFGVLADLCEDIGEVEIGRAARYCFNNERHPFFSDTPSRYEGVNASLHFYVAEGIYEPYFFPLWLVSKLRGIRTKAQAVEYSYPNLELALRDIGRVLSEEKYSEN